MENNHKYGLLVITNNSLSLQSDFEAITSDEDNNVNRIVNLVLEWSQEYPDQNGNNHKTPLCTAQCVIVEHSDWGVDQDNAINQSRSNYNTLHPDCIIPEDQKMIFDESERGDLRVLMNQ